LQHEDFIGRIEVANYIILPTGHAVRRVAGHRLHSSCSPPPFFNVTGRGRFWGLGHFGALPPGFKGGPFVHKDDILLPPLKIRVKFGGVKNYNPIDFWDFPAGHFKKAKSIFNSFLNKISKFNFIEKGKSNEF
jgi:hypothetical protein